jgi:hypothetical protein
MNLRKHQNLKKKIMKYSILFLLLFAWNSQAQQSENETKLEQQMEFTFNEYLGYVKVSSAGKTANLEINKAQAGLMARGAFDPKIAVDFDKKTIQRH